MPATTPAGRYGRGSFGIASHEALHLARRQRIRAWLPLLGRESARDPDEGLSPVWRAVNSLPAGHRACVGLYYLYGFSTEEIADKLHIPPGTVSSRLHTARERLRELLSEPTPEASA